MLDAVCRDLSERPGQIGLDQKGPDRRDPPVVEVGGDALPREAAAAFGKHLVVERREGHAALGQFDRRLQDVGEGEFPIIGKHPPPAGEVPGNGGSHVPGVGGPGREPVRCRAPGRQAQEHQHPGSLSRRGEHQGAAPREPRHVWLRDPDRGRGRHDRIDGVSPRRQHADPGQRRERIGRRDHPAPAIDDRAEPEFRRPGLVWHHTLPPSRDWHPGALCAGPGKNQAGMAG